MIGREINVSVAEQKVTFYGPGGEVWDSPCSTSKFGTGYETGSHKTPTGNFHICEKIGDDQPAGTIFKNRVPTGTLWDPGISAEEKEEDLILTRILWLAGDDQENANTYSRYIYFHGTNHEDKLGTPASHGCIRLSNADIITLFDLVEVGTTIYIQEN